MKHSCQLHLEDVNVFYDNRPVLSSINLCVKAGDFLGIIGPNGAGKTTLLKAILGIVKFSGRILFEGRSVKEQLDTIGYVPQQSRVNPDFPITVLQMCLLGLLSGKDVFKKFSEEDISIAKKFLTLCGYNDSIEKKFGRLSLGQKQRVLIARALMKSPKLLLLDEPTSSIDVTGEDSVFALLKDINEHGKTIIMVSHDIGVLSVYVDKIACLNNSLVYHGSANSLPEGIIEDTYNCPVEIIAHGQPHRVLRRHRHD